MVGWHAVFHFLYFNLAPPSSPIRTSTLQWSVRTYLVALVLACLLPGVLAASGLFIYQYREGRAQLEESTLHTARLLVQAVDSHLSRVQAVGQTLATSEALARRDLASFHRKAREVVALKGMTPNVVLRNREGEQLVNAMVDYGKPLPLIDTHPDLDHVFETGQAHISPVFQGAVMKQPVLSVMVPVFIDGEIAYSLALGVSPHDLSDILRAQSLPSGWVAAALDGKGTIFGRNIEPDRFIGNRATKGLFDSMMRADESIIETITQEGTPVLTFHSRSPTTGWTVAIGIPKRELQGSLMWRLSMAAAAMGLLFALGLILAGIMSGRIAASMKSLTAAANALGRNQPLPPSSVALAEAAEVEAAIGNASALLAERAAALELKGKELGEAHRLARFGTWHWDLETGEVETSESIPHIYGREVPPFPEQRGTVLTEESWDRVNEAMQRALGTGTGYDLELQVRHGDGYTIWIDAKSDAVVNEHGKVIALRGTVQDITERKRYEDALRASESASRRSFDLAESEKRRLAAVLEVTPVGVVVVDAEGVVEHSNAASRELWGMNHLMTSSVEAYSYWRGWWADGSERQGQPLKAHEWPMARALRGEEGVRDLVEIAPFDAPDVRRMVMMTAAVIRDGEGNIIGGVLAQMDITDRIKAEQELREASHRKDEFLAMLAHELRNPLAPIAAAADMLQLGVDPARVKQTSAVIVRQVKHMASLIDDLLDVSRVTRGLISLERQAIDVNRVVDDAVEQVKPLMQARNHAMIVHRLNSEAYVLGDSKRLVQIVANLLNNAAKFTAEGGRIEIGVDVRGQWVEIVVADNGIGMSPEVSARAFEMFAQGERTPDRSQGGLGIGLALVKSLVELHGGTARGFSEGIGKGCTFTVLLPSLERTENAAFAGDVSSPVAAPGKSLKILIVDDNADAATMLAMLVEMLGYEVTIEHSSVAALARARTERPDLCLLDIGLPEIDGRELARRLHAQPETAQTICVAITGYGQEQDRESILQAGFAHHLVKPVDLATLSGILEKVAR